ncbi:hypothetical protein OfM1_12120 [Lactovum odontotermitis]
MQIQYSNKVIERQCTELKQAKKDLSDKVAKKLHMLINFIERADNLSSLLAFPRYNFHKLRGERLGQYASDIATLMEEKVHTGCSLLLTKKMSLQFIQNPHLSQ